MEKKSRKLINKKESNPLGIMELSLADVLSVEYTHAEANLRQSTIRKHDRQKKEYWKPELISIIHMFIILSIFLLFNHSVSGFVIAPPWANPEVNKCSKKSWQLIYWPQDDKCYQIFEQGPCPRSQELGFNEITGAAECRCPKNLLYWPATDRCYEEHSRGPCEVNQYLVSDAINNSKNEKSNSSRTTKIANNKIDKSVRCKNTKICANGWIFWPSMQECFQLYTQGPCHKGDLLIMNALTAEPYCGCDPLLLRQYYFPPLRLCYEHHTRGPCESGLLFAYNHTADLTHCLCAPSLDNFHPESQQCFQFGTKGPCQKGQIYKLNSKTGYGECRCRDNYVSWHSNGECYKTYTPGPCRSDQFIVPSTHLQVSGQGLCVRNPCPRAHLFFPGGGYFNPVLTSSSKTYNGLVRRSGGIIQEQSRLDEAADSRCYKVGSRGPCPLGQLVVFERYSGKSFKGECGCSEGYNQNYWPETGQCFEWYSRGPCPESFLFVYNRKEGKTECICDEQDGYVFWNETGRCYRVYSQGPCPNNAWLIPSDDLSEVFCECRNGYFFSSEDYACILKSTIVKQLESKILPYLRNQAKHRINQYNNKNGQKEKFSSDLAEKIQKNAWTNLPELLRQIALANAQKQQQERGGAKIGYLQPVNRRDFRPSTLASDDNFDNEPRGRIQQPITSPGLRGRVNKGSRSQSESQDTDEASNMNEDEKHLLYHNIQMKNGGIKWTRGIFVKPDSEVSGAKDKYNQPSNRDQYHDDRYEMISNYQDNADRKSNFKSKIVGLGSQELHTKRNSSHNRSSTRLINESDSFDNTYTTYDGYNRQKYSPRRRNKFNQGYGSASGENTEEIIQLGTTASGTRKHFPKRQNNPLEIVSERRIDDAIITSSLPRQGKQSLFERQITDSIATLSSEGLSQLENQKPWNARQSQLHREWWKTFQKRSGPQTRNSQRRRSRTLISKKSSDNLDSIDHNKE